MKNTRREPCDWPASHRTCSSAQDGPGNTWTLSILSSFSPVFFCLILSQPGGIHTPLLHTRYKNATTFAFVRSSGEHPSHPHHTRPQPATSTYMHRNTLVYSTMDTGGSSSAPPRVEVGSVFCTAGQLRAE